MRLARTLRRQLSLVILVLIAACRGIGTEPTIDPVEARDRADARTAWTYIEQNTLPATGLANAVEAFPMVTVWDIASLIGAIHSAHELGLIDDIAYEARIRQILGTLQAMPLFDRAAYNKFYDGRTGEMVDRTFKPTATGYGWSATDVGRLLIWLRILAVEQPQFAEQAGAIVKRLDMTRIVKNGNLEAVDLDPATGAMRYYAETGLGYEQYAASGYALWGHRAVDALNPNANVATTRVFGVDVAIDRRGTGRVTSEPYVMMGLETGWYSPTLREHAERVLAAQQARYEQTGVVTMVSEDHLPDAPHFFYYYSVYSGGRSFVVEGPDAGMVVQNPRWVSTKAAFAWRALIPNSYTRAAVDLVQASAIPRRGWGTGVYEGTTVPTGEANLNTAGMVLEALAYQRTGRPFLSEPIQ
jgi:hypothetical protein